ncbi:MAG: putative histidine kinase, classic [Frankiales bacterium]|nr:putative histidine kinase, classic [Frankiales bacterium]
MKVVATSTLGQHLVATPEILIDPGLMAQIVAASADAIFSEDLDGRITSWNAGAERLYGRSAEDMLGCSTIALLPDETALQLQGVHAAALSGQRVERFDTWHLRPDGGHVPVSLTVSPLLNSDGRVVGLATSAKDVTERVQHTAELADVHRTLEKQYVALGRSNRDLEQFAYVASHDLAEPLRVMTGFVQLLEKRYADALDERGSRYIFHVVDGAARMRVLIDDLLEYSRFLRSEPGLEVVDTNAVALRAVASEAAGEVEIGDLPPVWCDEAAVFAVLQNLISNAVKFHRPEAPSRVKVSGEVVGGIVHLYVDDDGIGIEPEYRERIFGMFSRLHVREAYAGTGIGLAIVQQVVERSEGRAWVEESELGGSRFCVTLPAPPAGRAAA